MSTVIHIDRDHYIHVCADSTTLAELREALNVKGGYLHSECGFDIVTSTFPIPSGTYTLISPRNKPGRKRKTEILDEIEEYEDYYLKFNNNNHVKNGTKRYKTIQNGPTDNNNNTPEKGRNGGQSTDEYEEDEETGTNNLDKVRISKKAPQITIKHLVDEKYLAVGEILTFKTSAFGAVVRGEISADGAVRDTKSNIDYDYLNRWANAHKMKTINWAHVTILSTGSTMLDLKKKYYFDHPQLFE